MLLSALLGASIFQSTLPRGERRGATETSNAESNNFNPRSHEGSDPATAVVRSSSLNFNPRSHEGSDHRHHLYNVPRRLFQSTLPRGERHLSGIPSINQGTFQSTLPRGERRLNRFASSILLENFNPRSHEGSDGLRQINLRRGNGFQSTLPRGERPGWYCIHNVRSRFQSTLP